MLANLVIHDFAIIEHLEVNFEQGMTVLSGETGAGKSIIIDALGLLVGGRGSSDFIRTGTKKTDVQGLFVVQDNPQLLATLTENDIELDGQNILLERELSHNGRNVCRVNNKIVTTAILRKVGEQLVDIHGQNEHQELMRAEQHLHILDQYGRTTITSLLNDYQTTYRQYRHLQKQIADKNANEQAYAQRLDMLQFQIEEITSAKILKHEDDDLELEQNRLSNFQKINQALQQTLAVLSTDESNALDLSGVAMDQLNDIANFSSDFHNISENLNSAYYTLQDVISNVQDQLDSLEFDEGRLNDIEQRLETLNNLKRKYGPTLSDVQDYHQKIKAEYSEMQQLTDESGQIEVDFQAVKAQLTQQAQALTAVREQVAVKLEQNIHLQLRSLYMDKAVFKVQFTKAEQFLQSGQDQVAFYLQTNPGEALKPLVKIASGGELSRIMLAIKTIIAQGEGVTSIIFDEVDTGVSGRVAQAIADKISVIANHSQVLCITHLPQVAAMSDHQYLIEKKVAGGRTTTTLQKVTGEQRVLVIAKMIAGKEVTRLAEEHAAELLRQADETKANR
ncbi:DNA repair protein RecN [Lapidilactobacillus bayanensis]|uniref:DNA repair protein RecN n=1 Tax=Lapidilactobacillus bayanensis TaxID=2485998 RepID=UPI000F76C338|nr:DNA repair protein RecN [Lapidilactobacillus bayanensis]